MNPRKLLFASLLALFSGLPGCGGGKSDRAPASATESECGDGRDNDGDGLVDCADLDCRVAGGSCALAPALDRTVATTLVESASFLYTGPDPLQREVDINALDPKRLAMVRGKVSDAAGAPLAGVKLRVLGHPEFGWTLSRTDGVFDMAVNGGGRLVFAYEKAGFVGAQRSIEPAWQRYATIPEAGLIPLAAKVSKLSSGASEPQIALGERSDDAMGSRQPLVILAPGTVASAVLPDGSKSSLQTLSVHVTEYPMEQSELPSRSQRFAPGSLPGSGNINYTLEFAVDEAEALGATRVTFNQPATIYVENFLGLAVGSPVPLGYYNRGSSQWEPSNRGGVVVGIVAAEDGTPSVDSDGDGKADTDAQLTKLGVTAAELAEISGRYGVGQSLWRAQVSHFSAWDYLWPVAAPEAASGLGTQPIARPLDNPSERGHVLVEKQVVQEDIGLAGTPLSLHYQTDRTTRFRSGFEISVPLVADKIPAKLKRVSSIVSVAGHDFDQVLPAGKNLSQVVDWDGTDGFGRVLQGRQIAHVSIGYVFDGSVIGNQVFGVPGERIVIATDSGARPEAVIWQDFDVPVGAFDASGFELGGFSLDALHSYDPATQIMYFGDGHDRSAQNVASIVTRQGKSADLGTPDSLFVAPDGSVIFTDDQQNDASAPGRLLKIAPDQTVSVIGGAGAPGAAGKLSIRSPQGIAMASDGSIVFADALLQSVRRIAPDGTVQTLVGGADSSAPLVEATLANPDGLAFGLRGELYIVSGNEVLKLEGGQLATFAGAGTTDADEIAANNARLTGPSGVAVGTDGQVFISERGNQSSAGSSKTPAAGGHRIRRVSTDGVIHSFAGTGTPGFSGDGLKATQAQLNGPRGLAVAPDGSVYVADQRNRRIRRITTDGCQRASNPARSWAAWRSRPESRGAESQI